MTQGIEYFLKQKVYLATIQRNGDRYYCDYDIKEGVIVGKNRWEGNKNQFMYDIQLKDYYLEDQTEYNFYTTKEEAENHRVESLRRQIETLRRKIKEINKIIRLSTQTKKL